jgi:hypothetical protein
VERLVGRQPPYHTPVYVLTHHPRAPLEMEGGTTFVNVGRPGLEQVRVVGAPGVTHIKYRVK